MRNLAFACAAAAALLAGPASAAPVGGKAPISVDPITETQFSIEVGPTHERWRSRRDEHRRWESKREGREGREVRCRTISEHVVDTSRTRMRERCRDRD